MFTRVRHWTLTSARWIQSTSSHPLPLRFILTIFLHLCLVPPETNSHFRLNFVCISHLSYAFYMSRPSHPPWFHHPNNTWWSVHVMELLKSQFSSASFLLGLNILLSTLHLGAAVPSGRQITSNINLQDKGFWNELQQASSNSICS